MSSTQPRIAVIGGGVIGLSTAWQLARHGFDCTLFEKNTTGRKASYVAAGMLAPHAEVGFEEVPLMKLSQHSLSLYPRFIEELEQDCGESVTLDPCGTLLCGIDRDDTEYLRRLYDFREELSLNIQWLGGSEAREIEPLLSPRVVSAVWLPDDAQVNNRSMLPALRKAFLKNGGKLKENCPVSGIELQNGSFHGLHTPEGFQAFDEVILSAGVHTPEIDGIPEDVQLSVRPVKGQIITLRKSNEVNLKKMIRTRRIYLVPKDDGTIRIGATSEEKGFNRQPTAGGIKELLEDAWEVIPSIYDLPLVESIAGLRPATTDHNPVVGRTRIPNVLYAAGHYRHGILLSPVTAYAMLEILQNGTYPSYIQGFTPQRLITEEVK